MLKYLNTLVTFSEVPDEVSLCINITNCIYRCHNCHSPELRNDIGNPLDIPTIDTLINDNKGITCVCLLGGDIEISTINSIAKHVHEHNLKVCWYTGSRVIPETIELEHFDFIKYGPYIEELGPLNSKTTNQVFLRKEGTEWIDITYKFQKVGD